MPTANLAKRRSSLKRAADPSKEASAKTIKSVRKGTNVAGEETPQKGQAEARSFLREAESKLATWVGQSKAARADAKKADLELYNKKAGLLRSVLKQMIGKARAGELMDIECKHRMLQN